MPNLAKCYKADLPDQASFEFQIKPDWVVEMKHFCIYRKEIVCRYIYLGMTAIDNFTTLDYKKIRFIIIKFMMFQIISLLFDLVVLRLFFTFKMLSRKKTVIYTYWRWV